VAGQDEKRAYTLCVASTPAGDILPFQQVWSGKTKKALPAATAGGMTEAMELGFDFAVANSPKKTSHYSTLGSMKQVCLLMKLKFEFSLKIMAQWMTNILRPYLESYIEIHRLPPDQKAILYIDCYPVHIGEDFRTYVFKEFPNIFLIFVPANC
jgi:hypothetical protein